MPRDVMVAARAYAGRRIRESFGGGIVGSVLEQGGGGEAALQADDGDAVEVYECPGGRRGEVGPQAANDQRQLVFFSELAFLTYITSIAAGLGTRADATRTIWGPSMVPCPS